MEKLYDRIYWHNNTTPALNETNLNAMSKAIDDIDDRVVGLAADVMEAVPEVRELVEEVETLTQNPPYIGQNGNWYVWDTNTGAYVDSGVDASISVTVGTTTTLEPGNNATVTNVGTSTDPVLNFGIPKGPKGDPGDAGHTIVNPAGTDMTMRNKLQFANATVTDDSANNKTVVTVPTMTGATSGAAGAAGYVPAPAAGDQDKCLKGDGTWGTVGGGHTIINSSGTAMTQRSKLKFSNATVTDDSTNDVTIVNPTQYIDQNQKTTASGVDTFSFSSALITSNSAVEVFCNVDGADYNELTVSNGTATVKYNSSLNVTLVRLYIRG